MRVPRTSDHWDFASSKLNVIVLSVALLTRVLALQPYGTWVTDSTLCSTEGVGLPTCNAFVSLGSDIDPTMTLSACEAAMFSSGAAAARYIACPGVKIWQCFLADGPCNRDNICGSGFTYGCSGAAYVIDPSVATPSLTPTTSSGSSPTPTHTPPVTGSPGLYGTWIAGHSICSGFGGPYGLTTCGARNLVGSGYNPSMTQSACEAAMYSNGAAAAAYVACPDSFSYQCRLADGPCNNGNICSAGYGTGCYGGAFVVDPSAISPTPIATHTSTSSASAPSVSSSASPSQTSSATWSATSSGSGSPGITPSVLAVVSLSASILPSLSASPSASVSVTPSGSTTSSPSPTYDYAFDPCYSYTEINDPTREITYISSRQDNDEQMPAGWYRFTDGNFAFLPSIASWTYRCNTRRPVYVVGDYPAAPALETTVIAYAYYSRDFPVLPPGDYNFPVTIRHCGTYVVYFLVAPFGGSINATRYCTTSDVPYSYLPGNYPYPRTPSATRTLSASPSASPSVTRTRTWSFSKSQTRTATPTCTTTRSTTSSASFTRTSTTTPSNTRSVTPTKSGTRSNTATGSTTKTQTTTATNSRSNSSTRTTTKTTTLSATNTRSTSSTPTNTKTTTVTPSGSRKPKFQLR